VLASLKEIDIRHAHQTIVVDSADLTTANLLHIGLGAPTAECRCVVIDGKGVAIYVADITYRSEAIQLHIDLLANSRAASDSPGRARPAKGAPRAQNRGVNRRPSRLHLISS